VGCLVDFQGPSSDRDFRTLLVLVSKEGDGKYSPYSLEGNSKEPLVLYFQRQALEANERELKTNGFEKITSNFKPRRDR
jgi:hypothetical protein